MSVEPVRRKCRIALVIGAGSIKCAASIGVLDVLGREGIDVDLYVGCSGGAMYAAFAALGFTAEEAERTSRKLWTRDLASRRNRRAFVSALFPRRMRFDESFGMLDDEMVNTRLRNAFGERTFADASAPLFIVGTDFRNGQKVVMSDGPLFDAIRGSIAIPFLFRPWRVGERLITDGSLSDPMPIDVAIRERAEIILGIGFRNPYQVRVNSLPKFAYQVVTIMTNQLLTSNFAFQNLAHHNEVLLLVPEFGRRVGAFDAGKLDLVIDAGRRSMESHLDYLRQLIRRHEESPPPSRH